jgi:threonine/homoserine/homoserine lactone efflux protein
METAFLAYGLALTVAAMTPGPSMLTVVSTGMARGPRPALAASLGITLADVILVAIALAGLATLMATMAWLLELIKYAGAAYLVWIGVRMWRARPAAETVASGSDRVGRSLLLGFTVALSNPKAILFHASMIPLILDLDSIGLADALIVLTIVAAVNIATMGFYSLVAGGAARWFRTPSRVRLINRIAGGTMVGTGAVIAAR